MSLKAELFSLLGHAFTGRDVILVLGGQSLYSRPLGKSITKFSRLVRMTRDLSLPRA